MQLALIIIGVFVLMGIILFCTFFSAKLAQMKGRKKSWGAMGFFFNILGLLIVCYLPSKKKDGVETNPVRYLLAKIPNLSRRTINLIAAMAVVVVVAIFAIDQVPQSLENMTYSRQLAARADSGYISPTSVTCSVTSIYAGEKNTFAILNSSDIYNWGYSVLDYIDKNQPGLIYKNAKKIQAVGGLYFILTNDGDLFARGDNTYGHIPDAGEFVKDLHLIASNVKDFCASATHIAVINERDRLLTWGDNKYGQLGTGDKESVSEPEQVLRNVKSVSCSARFTVAVTESGDMYVFGNNAYGQFGLGNTDEQLEPVKALDNIGLAACGDDFIVAISRGGTVFTCGNNSFGQLGDGTFESRTTFKGIIDSMVSVGAGGHVGFAISSKAELYMWGQNNYGQLGNGSLNPAEQPQKVASSVIEASTSGLHTVILTSDSKLLATGSGSYGQLGRGDKRDRFETLAAVKEN